MGHSDADVALHALMDALLGAAALGDIGELFPDNDERYAGADSFALLLEVVNLLSKNGWKIVNLDVTIVAEAPRIRPYVEKMRKKLALGCEVDESCVSVKGTTTEKLGFCGRGEGICALASVLIDKK